MKIKHCNLQQIDRNQPQVNAMSIVLPSPIQLLFVTKKNLKLIVTLVNSVPCCILRSFDV